MKEVEAKFFESQGRDSFPKTQRSTQVPESITSFGNQIINTSPLSNRTFRRMKKDPIVKAGHCAIVEAVKSKGWKVVGGKEEHREFIKQMFSSFDLTRSIEEFLTAFQFGYAAAEKVFDLVNWRGRRLWAIKKYVHLDPDSFRFKQEKSGEIQSLIQKKNFFRDRVNTVRISEGGIDTIKIPPWKFTAYIYDGKFGYPYGESGYAPAYKSWLYKNHLLKHWARFLEQMGGGMFVGRAGWAKTAKMRDELKKMKSGSVVVLGQDQELDIVYPPSGNSQFPEMLSFLNAEILQSMGVPSLIIGQATEFGSRSLSETHFALFKLTRIQPLQNEISELFIRDIIQIIDSNWGPQEEYPKLVFNQWTTLEREQIANLLLKAAKMQMIGTADLDWVREELEFPSAGPEGIGDPVVRKVDDISQPSPGSGDGGDTQDDIDSTKREGGSVG